MVKSRDIDAHVGARLRLRRVAARLSQRRLGRAVGLTGQQVHKYEHGLDRIGSSWLYELAKALDVPISYFFEGVQSDAGARGLMPVRSGSGLDKAGAPVGQDNNPQVQREARKLVEAYCAIGERRVRQRIRELVKALGQLRAAP